MLGVMPYIKDDSEIYTNIFRILKKDGVFIISQQNELFDLFTFNDYTVNFFKKHFVSILDEHQIDTSSITESISNFYKHNEPDKHKDGSARDKVFHKSENPLLYSQKLLKYGFRVMGDYEYYSIHFLPPILLESNKDLAELSDKEGYNYKNSET